MTAAVYVPSDTWSGYESDNNNDNDDKEAVAPWKSYFDDEPPWKKCFDENFNIGACNDCWKGATAATDGTTAATDGAACNVTLLLPPTAPDYDSPYFCPLAWIESMLIPNGEKKQP